MREVKVRAWDNVENEMFYAGEDMDVLFALTSNGIECTDIRHVMPSGDGVNSKEHLQYMQYTGLKDKNGVLIYERDILKIPVDGNRDLHGDYSLQEVFFKNGTYITSHLISEKGQILPKGYTVGFLLDHYDFDHKSFLFNENPYMDTEIEVVGNIFEDTDVQKLIFG